MTADLTLESRVARAPDAVFTDVDGETVLMSVANGEYYALDPVGSRIWALLEEPTSVADLCDRLLAEYEVEPDRCRTSVLALLADLAGCGLLEVRAPSP